MNNMKGQNFYIGIIVGMIISSIIGYYMKKVSTNTDQNTSGMPLIPKDLL